MTPGRQGQKVGPWAQAGVRGWGTGSRRSLATHLLRPSGPRRHAHTGDMQSSFA